MALYSSSFGDPTKPCLVFLHGLLGSSSDWLAVMRRLSHHYFCVAIDLPGHGHSAAVTLNESIVDDAAGFEAVSGLLAKTLRQRGVHAYTLIGYSLGARVAMYHAVHMLTANVLTVDERGQRDDKAFPTGVKVADIKVTPELTGLILEGGHFGLAEDERSARLQHDQQWADRFATEPLATVLEDWYQQPVFAHLTPMQRERLVLQRRKGCGRSIATIMKATSLGCQPRLDIALLALAAQQTRGLPIHYIVGEWDSKFKALAQSRPFSVTEIAEAGHNTHHEAPDAFSVAVHQFIESVSAPR